MAWFRMMGVDSVEYHRENVLRGADGHPGAALAYYGRLHTGGRSTWRPGTSSKMPSFAINGR